jgi:hypothetical protein
MGYYTAAATHPNLNGFFVNLLALSVPAARVVAPCIICFDSTI